MYLKCLEIVGFKSFAPPTTIHFHRGVTAIVGPNGCGKSNVLDSIRWVLGETSAKALRGTQMQDVIFSGTDSRKSMGMAEVSMTFAECEEQLGVEYNEVRITRRVFRDGRSEYEINKTPCRLKDIHKLFMDTGVGRSAYSIMEQGKIDQILSSKPEDRRAVFEEAAGITRFKAQKKEALRKLELTEINLSRVTDITKEVGRQIGSLQRQAGKARRYQEIHSELRDLETRWASHQYHQIKAKLNDGESLVRSLQQQYEEIQSGAETREETVRQRRAEVERLEQKIRSLEQERANAEGRVQRAHQQISFNLQRIEELLSLKERNKMEIIGGEEKLRIQRGQFDSISREYETVNDGIESIRTELNGHKASLDAAKQAVADNLGKRSRLDSQIAGIDKAINEARNRIAGIDLQKKNYSTRQVKLDEDEALFKAQSAELGEKCRVLAEKSAAQKAEIERLVADAAAGQEQLQQIEAQMKQARADLEKKQVQLEENEASVRALEKTIEALSGLSENARNLLSAKRGQGVMGTLLDYIKVQPGYEKAVETALGTACETVLVESPQVLERLLQELGDSGTMAFADLSALGTLRESRVAASGEQMELPLGPLQKFWGRVSKVFGGKTVSEPVGDGDEERRPANSSVPLLSEFVSSEGEPRRLALRILGNFLFAENADEASALRKVRTDKHIVTREGEVWFREGWQIRGKARGEQRSVFQYENQLAGLRKAAGPLREAVEQGRAALEVLSTSQARRQEQTALLQKSRQELEAQLSAHSYEEKGYVRQRDDAANRLQAVLHERSSVVAQAGTDREDYKALEDSLHELEGSRVGKVNEQESLVEDLRRLNADVDRWTQAVTECRVKEASALQRLDAIREQKESISHRLSELEETASRLAEEIGDYESKSIQSRELIAQAEQSSKSDDEQIQVLALQRDEVSSMREGIQGELGGIEETLRVDRRRATELQTQFSREEVGVAEQRMKLEAIVERIYRQYEIDLAVWMPEAPRSEAAVEDGPAVEGVGETVETAVPEEPVEVVTEMPDWEAVETKVLELRERLDRMGPVNVEAITEYEELEQRLKFLQTQEQDLINSRDQLHEAIRKINLTTKVLFAETFEKVKKNFEEMFLEVFGGGKAQLVLQDENDPLECGIDIIARPPGKQLQSISLLSGGERTMTAVALMFAIYMVKPSPFCFLDEMDAPLDESNINRFIRILQRFVQQSQFVVITHNKRTISSADVLYGVTMEEHGVSKMVSVKLSRKEESPLFANSGEQMPPSIADSIRGESVLPSGSSGDFPS